jgi:hypothetical protein
LYANGDSLPQVTSGTFTVNAATANKLVFTTQPSTTTAGSSISPAVVVKVEDTYGNTITGFTGSVTISSGTTSFNGGTLSVNAVAGVATFSAVNPTTAGSANTLYANGDSLPQVTSGTFTVNAATANKLVFTTQPGNGTGGSALSTQPQVTLEDQYGNTVTGTAQNVTVAIQNNAGPGGTLSGTTTVAVNTGTGVATFSGLSINKIGTGYTLTATGSTVDTTAGTIVSSGFNVTVGAASQLVFTTQPSASTVAGVAFAQQPVVTIEDAGGNTVTSGADSTVSVGLTLTTGTGALGGTALINAVNGVADFTGKGLSINYVGTDKVLTATATVTAGTRTTTTSPAFAITLPPISILRGPGAGVKIHVSNLLTSDATWDGYGSQAYASSDTTTANSVSLAISGSGNSTLIVYPSSAANTADSFNYTINDSNGTRTGTVNIVINTNLTGQAGSISVNGSGATMTFYGVPGDHYTVQRAGAVNGPWTDITVTSINASVSGNVITAPSGGAFTVTDGSPPPGSAYYQLRVAP